jgi:hypothetical protein
MAVPKLTRIGFTQSVRLSAGTLVAAGCLTALTPSAPASAVPAVFQPTVVSAVPASYTPDVADGIVYTIGQVGSTVFIGGSFTAVSPHGSTTTTPAPGIAAFTAGTGARVTTFAPTITGGPVRSIIPGPIPGTVYVGGGFNNVDGVATRVVLLDATTGAIVPGWKAKNANGPVWTLASGQGQLFVGGTFKTFAGTARGGFATLDPTSGALTTYSTLAFTGHHNFGVHCTATTGCANGGVGVKAMDVSPDGTRLAALGNFTNVSGFARDQLAIVQLGGGTAVVDPNWNTDAFTAACSSNSFDSYVRDVQFSPDGSYLVVAATGGAPTTNIDGTTGACDAATRFETADGGSDIRPTWVDWTGHDTLLSVSITGTAVYVGGHQRWLNNNKGLNNAKEGAVPRPGLGALDPQNGVPLAWNPGRNPRGAGAYALLATADGLYVGSDTDWIGNFTYHRKKIAFFPLAGGATLASNSVGSLPGQVYLFNTTSDPAGAQTVTWDGSTPPIADPDTTGFNNATVRGAFAVNNNLYFGSTDGHLYEAPFVNGVVGTATAVDPYDDPVWDNVQTGSGDTYQGVASSFYSELGSLTSTFYSAGRVYYTLSGKTQMFYRYFEPDDGVMGSQELTTTDGLNWSKVAGAFLSNGTLYFANSTTGNLMSVPFVNGQAAGTPVVANSSMRWSSRGDVVVSAPSVP